MRESVGCERSRSQSFSPSRHRRRHGQRTKHRCQTSISRSPRRNLNAGRELASARWLLTNTEVDFPNYFELQGFRNADFNATFRIRPDIQLNNQPTYWDEAEDNFLYFKDDGIRTVCPRFDASEDLFAAIKAGGLRGLAFEEETIGTWQEYDNSKWVLTDGIKWRRIRETSRTANLAERGTAIQNASSLLESRKDIDEVLLLPAADGTVRVALRFTSAVTAKVAAELGQALIGHVPEGIRQATTVEFKDLQAYPPGPTWTRPTALVLRSAADMVESRPQVKPEEKRDEGTLNEEIPVKPKSAPAWAPRSKALSRPPQQPEIETVEDDGSRSTTKKEDKQTRKDRKLQALEERLRRELREELGIGQDPPGEPGPTGRLRWSMSTAEAFHHNSKAM